MDRKLQDHYEARFDMMASTGWKELLEDAQQIKDAISGIENVIDQNDLCFKQGQLDILNWLFHLKAVTEDAYDKLSNEND